MRQLALITLVLAIASVPGAAFEDSASALKERLANAPPDERPSLSIRIAEQQLREADRLYTQGDVERARAAVDDVATYTEKARDAAIDTKKHAKNIEIAARKMSEKLRDIKRTLAFEDQPPLEQAIRRLEEVRTSLLKDMFSGKKDKKK